MKNFEEISSWRQTYGLLPIHLKNCDENKFLMLNGGYGDFCLQTSGGDDIELCKEYSWSTNTKNYLSIQPDNIQIVNWLDSKPEIIKKNDIEANLSKFYKYLLSKSYKTQNDVVPFIIDIFKQLRNETCEKQDPSFALSILFQLLLSIDFDDLSNISDNFIYFEKAKLPLSFEYYKTLLTSGVKSIKPNLDLILRHTAGSLFQEAHKEVLYFDLQRDLFGGLSSNLITKTDSYSSIHYTPPYLARTIVENSLRVLDLTKDELRILDPSCGSSEFLIEALKQLKFLNYRGKINIIGFDSSVSAIETSRFLLHYENQTQWKGKIHFNISHVEDSLIEDWGINNDLILMNPPFVSWEQLKNKDSRDILKTVLKNTVTSGKPNQASAFFYKASKSINDNGVLGCVLPSAILTDELYSNLRDEVKENFELKLLGKLGNFVFEDALTDVSIFIGKKPESYTSPKIIWIKNEKGTVAEALREFRILNSNNEIAKLEVNYNIFTPKIFPFFRNSWKLISHNEESFIRELEIFIAEKKLIRLSDVFNVKQGIRTGDRKFILSQSEFNCIPENERKYYKSVITNDSIKYGHIKTKNYVWYPYSKNEQIFQNENDFSIKAPFSYNRLIEFKNRLAKRARKTENNWWHLSEHRAWLRENEKRLFSTEFGNSDSFAFDESGDLVVERGHGWIPKKKIEIDDYYFYLAILSSTQFNNLLSIFSKPILSGYYLGKIYTKDIPIPNLSILNKEDNHYIKLVLLAKDLEKGNSSAIYSINEEVQLFYPKI